MGRSRDRSLSRERRRHGSRERRHNSRSPDTRPGRSDRGYDRGRSPRDDRERHRHSGHRERRRSRSREDAQRNRAYEDRRPHGREGNQEHCGNGRGYGDAYQRNGGYERPAEVGIPEVGSIHRGTVASVRPFGVFVRSRTLPRDGLVHASQIDDQIELSKDDPDDAKIQALTWAAQPGSQVWVMVVDIEEGPGGMPKLACSMRAVDQESGQPLMSLEEASQRRRGGGGGGGAHISGEFAGGSAEPPEVGAIVKAIVEKVAHFGVFVKMRGFAKSGLVYSSQVSDYLEFGKEDSPEEKAAALASVVSPGEHVWVKVVEVSFDERGPRTGCSMKVVDQKTGSDLDPQGLKYRPRGEGGFAAQRQKETVGVVTNELNIEWGHLAADVVQYGNSKDYAIVGDEVEAQVAASRMQQSSSGAAPSGAPHGHSGSFQTRAPGGGEAPAGPRGRGRDAVQPAWMTQGIQQPAAAPGSSVDPPSTQVSSVAEALAIIEKLGGGKHKKAKKKKDSKKTDKKTKAKKSKHKKSKDKSKQHEESSSDSDS